MEILISIVNAYGKTTSWQSTRNYTISATPKNSWYTEFSQQNRIHDDKQIQSADIWQSLEVSYFYVNMSVHVATSGLFNRKLSFEHAVQCHSENGNTMYS